MTLREKQSIFVKLIADLINKGSNLGYEFTFGDAHRSIEEATRLGKKNSLHTKRLAIDLNLFIDGKYKKDTQDYQRLGEIWESYSTSEYTCYWGGRFSDGNHFSIGHLGVK